MSSGRISSKQTTDFGDEVEVKEVGKGAQIVGDRNPSDQTMSKTATWKRPITIATDSGVLSEEEFERKYDLTPVKTPKGSMTPSTPSYFIDPWEVVPEKNDGLPSR
jgi:hypothetical protein